MEQTAVVVFIIESDPATQKWYKKEIERQGISTISAHNFDELSLLYKKNKSRIHLLILGNFPRDENVKMKPLIKKILAETKGVTVLVASSDREQIVSMIELTCMPGVVSPDLLPKTVEEILWPKKSAS